MKYLIWIISGINVYFGINNFLNVINILQTSKNSKVATVVFTILFLGMGIGGFYLSIVKNNQKLALWIGIGPWILSLIFMFLVMLTSDYK